MDHGGSGSTQAELPEPSFAERARTLVEAARTGMLATQCLRQPGFPFGSIAPYGVDAAGRPTLLFSTMAEHTRNLTADPRASLLVAEPARDDDPLAAARLTLVGRVVRLDGEEAAAARADYLRRHQRARAWVEFDDFGFHRLDPVDCYFVGGFGVMGWLSAEDYRAAAPDPLAPVAAGILEHMNADHADALVLYCRAFAGVAADAATMVAVDRLGFRVRADVGGRPQGLRVAFSREVRSAGEARTVLVQMVRDARARLQEA
jgi:putative heme iron utilization protein